MPRLSAWFVRLSLLYLAIGFTIGGIMLAYEGLAFASNPGQVLPAHIEILMIGWVMQLAMGIAYWILPRHSQGPPRGSPLAAWSGLILINVGILLVVSDAFFNIAWLPLFGRALEVVSILIFISIMWKRVRSSMSVLSP